MKLAGLCTNTITPWVGVQGKKAWEDQACRRILLREESVDPTQLALCYAPRRLPVPGSHRPGHSGSEIVFYDNM